jgi:hypothetical protein
MATMATKDPNEQATSALQLLAAYIPSEAIALYLAALGILTPAATASEEAITRVRLICFLLGAAAAVLIAFVGVTEAPSGARRGKWYRRIVVAILANVAFVAYAAATPTFFYSNTFLTIPFTQWAAVATIVIALVLPSIAGVVGVRPRKA